MELQYQKYKNSVADNKAAEKFRYIQVNPGYTVDLKEGIEYLNSDPTRFRKIVRDASKTAVRPYESHRFKDSKPFVLRSEYDDRF